MYFNAGNVIGILIGSAGTVMSVFAQSAFSQSAEQDALTFSAGLQQLHDSNFFRSSTIVDEQITRAGAGFRFGKQFSSQRVTLSASGTQYRYAEQDVLNATAFEGQASWNSQFTASISSQVDWLREETPVDKLEFIGKDLVAREDANARLSFGDGKRVGLMLGYHQLDVTHSNADRRELNYQDGDLFSEIRYRLNSDSWLGLRYREGDRRYEFLTSSQDDLDFKYRQWELETVWGLTQKTTLTGLVGVFDRSAKSGAVTENDGEGSLASLHLEWAVTEKLTTNVTYRFNQPAIGETSDAPSEISDGSVLLQWQFTPKVSLGFGASYVESDYAVLNNTENAVVPARTERNISITPLQVSWFYSAVTSVRLTGQWIDRRSPVSERDYHGYSASLALAFTF
jgi:hypothetical protein